AGPILSATTAAQNPCGSLMPPLSGSQAGAAAPPTRERTTAAHAVATAMLITLFMYAPMTGARAPGFRLRASPRLRRCRSVRRRAACDDSRPIPPFEPARVDSFDRYDGAGGERRQHRAWLDDGDPPAQRIARRSIRDDVGRHAFLGACVPHHGGRLPRGARDR